MAEAPEITQRTEQPYAAIRALVIMQTLGEVIPRLHPEVRRWLDAQGKAPAGPPFCRFNVIDMNRQLEIEAGFPVAAPVPGDGQVLAAVRPAGRYLTCWHAGHPAGLIDTIREMRDWAARQGLIWDMTSTPDGGQRGCRLEIYHDEPGQDMSEWQTELAFKLAG